MNIFHITVPHSGGVASRLINFCSPFAEWIGEISLRNKAVGIDFHVFAVALIATTIILNLYHHYCFIILSFLFFFLLFLLLLVTSYFGPFLDHGLPVARVSRPLNFMRWNFHLHAQYPTWNTRVSFFVWRVTPNLPNMGGPTSSYAIPRITVMYISAQKLSHPDKYVFDKVNFMHIYS